jgi:hypothetical protein
MAAVVLVGLVYFTCEIYDDCIVHANDNEHFYFSVRNVFQRFENLSTFLQERKPGKCKFSTLKSNFVAESSLRVVYQW